MPKIKDFLPWTKKKGSKCHEFHSVRHPLYSTSPATLAGHHPHLQQQFQIQTPPHSLSQKQHIYPQQIVMQSPQPPAYINQQQQQQQQVHQSPQLQLLAQQQMHPQPHHQQSLVASDIHCLCHQCSQQQHQQHNQHPHQQIHQQQHQHQLQHHQNQQQQHQNHQPAIPQQSLQLQQTLSNPNSLSHHNHHNQLLLSPQHISQPHHISQTQHTTTAAPVNSHSQQITPLPIQNHQTMCQHQTTQQPNQHCHSLTHNYVNQPLQQNGISNYQAHQVSNFAPQCVCLQHCPCPHQLNGHTHQADCPHVNSSLNVQHQIVSNHQTLMTPQASNQVHQTVQQGTISQNCASQSSNTQQLIAPVIQSSTTPNNMQHHLQQHQGQQFTGQFQSTPQQIITQQQQSVSTVQPQTIYHNHEYLMMQHDNQLQHTKQSLLPEQQVPKQQQVPQAPQHHQRVQSLHQQLFQQQQQQQQEQEQHHQQHQQQQQQSEQQRSLHKNMLIQSSFSQSQMHIPAYQNQQTFDQQPYSNGMGSTLNESSRYANMPVSCDIIRCSPKKVAAPTLSLDCSRSTKFEDHVYCNHIQELPPYREPPNYTEFIQNREMYAPDPINEQHLTCHSLIWQRTKDPGYDDLRIKERYHDTTFYKQESGLTS